MTETNQKPTTNQPKDSTGMSDKNKKILKYAVPTGLVAVLLIIVMFFANPFGSKTDNAKTTSSNPTSKIYDTNATDVAGQKFEAKPSNKEDEKKSQALNANLQFKRVNGGKEYNWDMGWLDVQSMKSCSSKFGGIEIPEVKEIGYVTPPAQLLRDIIPVPSKAEKKNIVEYPSYQVSVPLIYTNIKDMFDKDKDGKIDFNKRVNDNNIDSPLQTKLKEGVILLPISPLPGEVGNSYISGHTSNYSFVNSDYNKAFEPLMNKGKVGDTFNIYDCEGRKLPFKVFEAKEYVDDADTLWTNTTKRQVTLQGSVLKTCTPDLEALCKSHGCTQGKLCPTHRWIIKGELDLDQAKKINS